MLIGEYLGKITDKNRVALPKKFREEFSNNFIITRGYENCLIILDKRRWEKLIRVIEKKPFLNKSVRDTKRFIVGGASEIELDKQGRFVLSPPNLEYAELRNEVVFIGILDWVELWDQAKWSKKLSNLKLSASQIAEKLVG